MKFISTEIVSGNVYKAFYDGENVIMKDSNDVEFTSSDVHAASADFKLGTEEFQICTRKAKRILSIINNASK